MKLKKILKKSLKNKKCIKIEDVKEDFLKKAKKNGYKKKESLDFYYSHIAKYLKKLLKDEPVLIFLGTGHALVSEYYNTCFLIGTYDNFLLVDCGGGQTVLRQLKQLGIDPLSIKNIFITHTHQDHFLGLFWMLRVIGYSMIYGRTNTDLNLYGSAQVIERIKVISKELYRENFMDLLGKRIRLHELNDGIRLGLSGSNYTFFDIGSDKKEQFGFKADIGGCSVSYLGDERFRGSETPYVKGTDYLIHEAFCLNKDEPRMQPFPKGHSTVKYAAKTAKKMDCHNLILVHTEDESYLKRERLYKKEAKKYYKGTVFVPDDLEIIRLRK